MYYKYNLTKEQRQQWWKSLSPDEQQAYVESKHSSKAKSRKNNSKRPKNTNLRYPSKSYPWLTEGVNDTNREEWLAMIHKKNPWLKLTA